MDIFNGGAITEYFFEFSNQNPFSDHFDNYGIGDNNYLNNTGSLIWPIFLGMVLAQAIRLAANKAARKFY
jgi:hypothetical protein